ncbi:MAG: cell division protein ZapA [Pseudomonadota bacterium]
MPEIDIAIAGRTYRVACDPGEETHLTAAARMIDLEADALRKTAGSIPESRLMLMSALIIADRLNSTEARLRSAEETLRDSEAALRAADQRLRNDQGLAPTNLVATDTTDAASRGPRDQRNLFADDMVDEAIDLLEQTAERLEALAEKAAPEA